MRQQRGGIGIGGGIGPGQDGRRLVTFCVEAAGLKATLAKIEGLGGKTTMAPMEVLGGPVIALFADPEGNVIGLVKEGSM